MQLIRGSFAIALFSAAAFVACAGHPGGTVGSPCYDLGDNDPDCYPDEICEEIEGGERYCLRKCNDHVDCDAAERCNGSKKGPKSCHPHYDDYDCDPEFENC
jgi:hypothetical protein